MPTVKNPASMPTALRTQPQYQQFGFNVEGRRKGYYKTPPEDALILARPMVISCFLVCPPRSSCDVLYSSPSTPILLSFPLPPTPLPHDFLSSFPPQASLSTLVQVQGLGLGFRFRVFSLASPHKLLSLPRARSPSFLFHSLSLTHTNQYTRAHAHAHARTHTGVARGAGCLEAAARASCLPPLRSADDLLCGVEYEVSSFTGMRKLVRVLRTVATATEVGASPQDSCDCKSQSQLRLLL
jgi:hypothetical protein